jgi:hypothetical protein
MNKKTMLGLFLIGITILSGNAGAYATLTEDIIDQSQETYSTGAHYRYIAQEFVPQASVLTKIEVLMTADREGNSGRFPIKIAIREHLRGKNLVTTIIPSNSLPLLPNFQWVEFDFEDIQTTPGKTYFIVVAPTYGQRFFEKLPRTDQIYWGVSFENPYANGTVYLNHSPRFLWPVDKITNLSNLDFCFRTYTKITG